MNTTLIDHKIEFMVWDDISKKFITSSYNNNKFIPICKDNIKLINVQHDDVSECFGWVSEEWEYDSKIYLMQRTALRSINDEPIYNHMIVIDELGDYYLVDMFNYDVMFMLSESHIEIVGNRFQHPQLLEMCK